jgi:hypothetical protein
LQTFGAQIKGARADPHMTVSLKTEATGSKISSADARVSMPLRALVAATAIATVFGASRISLSLASIFGAEKSVAGRALIEVSLRLANHGLKNLDAVSLTSVAMRNVTSGISGAPSRIVREIRGCKGIFDLDYARRGSADNP